MFDKKITTKHGIGGYRTEDSNMKILSICFQHELKRVPITKQARFIMGTEDVEVFGELKMFLPKQLERKCKSKLIWTKLTKIWQNDHNLIKGFLLNLVKGGYAITIVGHIAFLPKSLRRNINFFHSQWNFFSMLNMNPKIGNIVVEDIDDGKIDFLFIGKSA